jgi:hypothetical protein
MKFSTTAHQRWLIKLLLLLLAMIPVAGSKAVVAASPSYAAEWEVTFEVSNSKIRAIWIGRVWDYSQGDGLLVHTVRQDISSDCEIFGAPTFGVSDVTLDGKKDYIRCKIPNYVAIFDALEPSLKRCRCYYDGPPYAAADISPVYTTKALPVVYHNRLTLDVLRKDTNGLRFPFLRNDGEVSASWLKGIANQGPVREPMRVDLNNNLGEARLSLYFLNGVVENWKSNLFSSWQSNGFQIWAGYNAPRYTSINIKGGFAKFLADAGFWDAVTPQYADGFFMWESEAPTLYKAQVMPGAFGLDTLTYIYIGHNPTTDSYFEGAIRKVAVDPGCRGH